MGGYYIKLSIFRIMKLLVSTISRGGIFVFYKTLTRISPKISFVGFVL